MPQDNDCTACLARVDGTWNHYCFHGAHSVAKWPEGRPILSYPKAPGWCPGMVRREEAHNAT